MTSRPDICARVKISSEAPTAATAINVTMRINVALPTTVQSELNASSQREASFEEVYPRLKPSFSVLWVF